jgi:hypothetical protein
MVLKRILPGAFVVLLSSALFLMAAESQAPWVDLRFGDPDRSANATAVRYALQEMDGITALAVRLDAPIISARYDPARTSPERMLATLAAIGFRATATGATATGATATRTTDSGGRQAAPPKVYTNDDLPPLTGRDRIPMRATARTDAGAGTGAGPDADANAGAAPRSPVEDPGAQEREWRARFAQARMRLRDAEKVAWQPVTRLVLVGGGAGLGGSGAGASFPVRMKVWELADTNELREARQAMDALEEQLRKAGLPPGWSRE